MSIGWVSDGYRVGIGWVFRSDTDIVIQHDEVQYTAKRRSRTTEICIILIILIISIVNSSLRKSQHLHQYS